jgi:FkbM family methyltransferase
MSWLARAEQALAFGRYAMNLPPWSALSPILRRTRSISFSQYGEDALLYSLQPRANGFYVDVGAYHPWKGSNTYKLYLKGWTGLTIEPNPAASAAFHKLRPRDTHLTMGVAKSEGVLTYHRYRDSKFNSFNPDTYRKALPKAGKPIEVACRPLRDIVAEHGKGRHIDFLSVDCEGLDLEVLQSLDWNETRPTAVMLEDIEQFQITRDGGSASAITRMMNELGYGCVSQALFSFLFVDRAAINDPSLTSGFDFAATQLCA